MEFLSILVKDSNVRRILKPLVSTYLVSCISTDIYVINQAQSQYEGLVIKL